MSAPTLHSILRKIGVQWLQSCPAGRAELPLFQRQRSCRSAGKNSEINRIRDCGIASSAMRRSYCISMLREDIMNRRTTMSLAAMALLCLAVSLPAGSAVAQQKQQVSFKVPAENIKFGVQQNVSVGDVPNHILRLFETHATFPNNPPVINGLKLAEIWQRGLAEIADGAGRTSSYYLFVMENG